VYPLPAGDTSLTIGRLICSLQARDEASQRGLHGLGFLRQRFEELQCLLLLLAQLVPLSGGEEGGEEETYYQGEGEGRLHCSSINSRQSD